MFCGTKTIFGMITTYSIDPSSISSLLQINIFTSMYFLYLFGFLSSYPHSSKKDCGYLSSSFFIVPTESSTIDDTQIQWEFSLGGFLVGKSVLVLSLQDYQKLPPEVFYEKRRSWKFDKIYRKHLSLFLNKAAGHWTCLNFSMN